MFTELKPLLKQRVVMITVSDIGNTVARETSHGAVQIPGGKSNMVYRGAACFYLWQEPG